MKKNCKSISKPAKEFLLCQYCGYFFFRGRAYEWGLCKRSHFFLLATSTACTSAGARTAADAGAARTCTCTCRAAAGHAAVGATGCRGAIAAGCAVRTLVVVVRFGFFAARLIAGTHVVGTSAAAGAAASCRTAGAGRAAAGARAALA